MKLMSHRGNRHGPIPTLENSPDYVDQCVLAGIETEVDIRMVGEHFYLGHDFPQYRISSTWLNERFTHLLLHVKDHRALNKILNNFSHWHYFCHASDPFTATSHGYIWLHDMSLSAPANAIVPLITQPLLASFTNRNVFAFCTDFVD
jgi:hypothetical protein